MKSSRMKRSGMKTNSLPRRGLRLASGIALVSVLAVSLTGCGTGNSSGGNSTANAGTGTAGPGAGGNVANNSAGNSSGGSQGTAQIAYAGSLQLANDGTIGPAFSKATGYKYQGRGGGSFAVANLIKSGGVQVDVFESIGTAPIVSLGSKTANWAVGFASSPLVVTYSPKSPFASQLDAIRTGKKPLSDLFSLMEQPGFHLGRTDPATDPQGQSFVLMLQLAEKELHLKAGTASTITGGLENGKQIFEETSILSRLQAGQLDASSAYQSQAVQMKLPYIQLPSTINLGSPAQAKVYSTVHIKLANGQTVAGQPIEVYITDLSSAANPQAGEAFTKFVLSEQGLHLYQQEGYTLTPFSVWGQKSAIPAAIQGELSQSQ